MHREISRLDNEIDKVVISDTLTPEQTEPWRSSTRIVKRADAHDAVADLKAEEGGDILVFGSHTMWNDLLDHGLVDELHMMIGGVVLGGGTPIFESDTPVTLKLADARRFEGSTNLLVRYEASS